MFAPFPSVLPDSPSIRVAIVEDGPSAMDTLSSLIRETQGLFFAGSFGNSEGDLLRIPFMKPDVVLMDVALPEASGIDYVSFLKHCLPECHVIVLTAVEDSARLFQALRSGASGFLHKSTPPHELISAIRLVQSGGAAMTSQVARQLAGESIVDFPATPRSNAFEQHSPREREVLNKLAEGLLVKEIAVQLNVGFGTVRTYIRRIYEKLNVQSRAQAAAYYYHRQTDSPVPLLAGLTSVTQTNWPAV